MLIAILLLAAPAPAPPPAAVAPPAAPLRAAPARHVQEPEEEPSIGKLLGALRKRDVEWYERDRLVGELMNRGVDGLKALAKHASRELGELEDDWNKDLERYREDFADAAEELVEEQQPRDAEEEIETLRKEALAVTRGENLTKERIRGEIDPRLARLRELLRVTAREVRDSDEDLAEAREELEDLADELDFWTATWKDCVDLLAVDEEGARALRRIREPELVAAPMDTLDREEAWLAILATPMTERDRRVLVANRALRPQLDAEEAAGILHHNRIRIELGLHAQAIDVKLCEAGRGHSKDMHELGFFAHESPVEGKKTPSDRAALAGTSGGAENIARGQQTGVDAVMGWWYSPGHHRNMLSGATRIGIGRHEFHWTEMFG